MSISRISLKSILITVCMLFAVVPAVALSIVTWRASTSIVEEKAAQYLVTARNVADKIDRNLFERYGDVQAFVANEVVGEVLSQEREYPVSPDDPTVRAMNHYVDLYDIYFMTLLVDKTGKLVAVNSKDADGRKIDTESLYDRDFSDQSWFKDAIAGRFYESEDGSFTGTVVEHLYVDEDVKRVYSDEGYALGFTTPVFDQDGEVIAVWKNVTKFALVEEIVLGAYNDLKANGFANAEITLLDSSGNVIVDCDPSTTGQDAIVRDAAIIGKFNLADKGVEAAVQVVKGESGTLGKSFHARKEIDQIAAFSPFSGALGFPGMKWNALVRVPRADALASVNGMKRACLITSVVAAFASCIVAFLFSRAISNSLSQTINSMEAASNDDFSNEVTSSVSRDLGRMSTAMNKLLGTLTKAKEQQEIAVRLQQVIEDSSLPMMTIDRDLTVNYVNKATTEMLKTHSPTFRKLWPAFDADNIVGVCIDQFHRDPSHQRKLLSDPSSLPIKTDIKVAHLTIELNVTAIHDEKGNYVGNALQWQEVTKEREQEERNADFNGQIAAISRSQAMIEFELDGTIKNANENFLAVMGYSLDEIKGKHHRMFVDESYANSSEYHQFWTKLRNGEFFSDEFKRITKEGKEVWIQASYNPISDINGRLVKVVKYAMDVTEVKIKNSDYQGQLEAISKSQAVIEFDLDGTIMTANQNFLSTVGYSLQEIQGQHHRMFVEAEEASSAEYREFWDKLRRGEFAAGEFKRIGKGGNTVWIQASYNPILDLSGRPFKVVKYASDITAAKEMEQQVRESQIREKQQSEEQNRKVDALLSVVNSVAEGDLAVELPDLGDDAIGQVANGVGKAVEAIRSALLQVREVAATVTSSSQELASISEQISTGAQEQASSLEETAASLEEITSAVKQNTDNSQQAQQLSSGSREVAESGGSVVNDAVDAMTDINSASKKIAEIITTIDEIAFQTNLLALNAAVEAARAGEQGRGFAVVASEVRNLAQRSAGAAKEIKNLIQDSVTKVENGTELVNKSGETLEEIVTSVKRVADIVSEISAASTEQLTGIEQVNTAVSQMDRVTQTNAAQTEEMTGTSQTLLSHSDNLRQLVAAFNLGQGGFEALPQANTQNSQRPAATMPTVGKQASVGFASGDAHELDLIGVSDSSVQESGEFVEF